MHSLRRMIGLLIALGVILASSLTMTAHTPTQAQGPTETPTAQPTPAPTVAGGETAGETITFDGSALVSAVLEAAKTAYAARVPSVNLAISVSGTAGGFDKLCAGTLDVAMAYGPITDAQAALCREKGVEFVELLLGYDAVVVIVNTTSPATCLSTDQLNALLSPGAAGVNNWRSIDPNLADIGITALYGPPADPQLPARFLIDRLIAGEGLRSDIRPLNTPDEIADKINTETNAVGILTLAEFNRLRGARPSIRALQVKTASGPCIEANTVNLDEARYPAAESLYLYVNAAALDRPAVAAFLNYLLSTDGRRAVQEAKYVQAAPVMYDRGQNYIDTRRTGRTYSRIRTVNIPADTGGVINVDGSPLVTDLLGDLNAPFTPRFTSITLTTKGFGNEAGYRKLCANQVDVIGATRPPTDAEIAACQTANLQTLQLTLGSEALVVLVNGDNPFATCLSLGNLERIFSAQYQSGQKWSDVAKGFPETDMLVLMPNEGSIETDLLLSKIIKPDQQIAPIARFENVTRSNDAQFRAAAVQNVAGGVTFVRYGDFKKTTANVRALKIDAGQGCVAPTDATINDGSYPLATPLYLRLNLNSVSRPEVRAYLWHLVSDDALAVLARENVFGTDTGAFIAARDILLERFAQAEAAAATPPPTPEPTAEATVEATVETTVETTAEATAAPTAEATAEATPGQ